MANELVASLRPNSFIRLNGPKDDLDFGQSNHALGLRLLKSDLNGFVTIFRVPANLTVGTGYTLKALLVDDGTDAADLGKAVILGYTPKAIASGTDSFDITSGAATEVTATYTLNATSGVAVEVSTAITSANFDSVGAGGWCQLRVRRVGTSTSDTCMGPVLLMDLHILNT